MDTRRLLELLDQVLLGWLQRFIDTLEQAKNSPVGYWKPKDLSKVGGYLPQRRSQLCPQLRVTTEFVKNCTLSFFVETQRPVLPFPNPPSLPP